MEQSFTYYTKGTCSSQINIKTKDNIILSVEFIGGCNGNLQGIACLVEGMKINDVISRLEGIRCGYKSTSCPDQLCKALRSITTK